MIATQLDHLRPLLVVRWSSSFLISTQNVLNSYVAFQQLPTSPYDYTIQFTGIFSLTDLNYAPFPQIDANLTLVGLEVRRTTMITH